MPSFLFDVLYIPSLLMFWALIVFIILRSFNGKLNFDEFCSSLKVIFTLHWMVFVQTRKAIVYSMNSNGPGRHKVVHLLASFAGNSYCNGYTDRHFLFSPHSPTCSLKEHSEARLQNSPYFFVFKYARAVKQKVWTRALRARKTPTPRFTDFFTDFEKKPDCFAVYGEACGGG